jgi:hypothetical protein
MKISFEQPTSHSLLHKSSGNYINPYSKINFKGINPDIVSIPQKEKLPSVSKLKEIFPKLKEIFPNLKEIFPKLKKNLSPKETLEAIGVSDANIDLILNVINKMDLKENFKTIISDLPKIEDKELLGKFLCLRSEISRDLHSKFDKGVFDLFNSIYNSNPSLQNSQSLETLSKAITFQKYDSENLSGIDEFLDNDEYANYYLEALCENQYTPNKSSFEFFKKFTELGCERDLLLHSFTNHTYPFDGNEATAVSKLKDLQKNGLNSEYLLPMLETVSEEKDLVKLCHFIKKADERRNILGATDGTVEKIDFAGLFLDGEYSTATLNLLNIWGENSLLNLMSEGLGKIDEYLNYYGAIKYDIKYMQPFIKLVNPTNSDEYINLSNKIKDLKSRFGTIKDNDKKMKLINEINTISKQRTNIINNSIKDIAEKINTTRVYLGMIKDSPKSAEDYKKANALIPYMNQKTNEGKLLYKTKLNELLWDSLEIECPEKLKKELNFTDSKYIEKMFFPTEEFSSNFKNLIKILKKSNKNIANTLDNLPQNKVLANVFKKGGLSYKAWAGSLPDLKVEFDIQNDFEGMSKNTIKNLENEFNDVIYKRLPETQRNNIKQALSKGGYSLVEREEANYVDAGFYNGSTKKLRLVKGDKPIEFNDLSKIFKILNNIFDTDIFWETKHSENSINNIKGTFKNHINTRHSEMERVKQCKNNEISHIQIQKVDMNDIKHSLFLGNDAVCCTAIGSFNDWSAPNYIKNKMVQAIELKDGDEYIGNTMIYLANVDGETGLFLDNIELKPKYQYNDKIEQGIIEFAKKFVKELNAPDMDIYAGPNRHRLDMKNFKLIKSDNIFLIGTTAGDEIYLDFIGQGLDVDYNKSFSGSIYKLLK